MCSRPIFLSYTSFDVIINKLLSNQTPPSFHFQTKVLLNPPSFHVIVWYTLELRLPPPTGGCNGWVWRASAVAADWGSLWSGRCGAPGPSCKPPSRSLSPRWERYNPQVWRRQSPPRTSSSGTSSWSSWGRGWSRCCPQTRCPSWSWEPGPWGRRCRKSHWRWSRAPWSRPWRRWCPRGWWSGCPPWTAAWWSPSRTWRVGRRKYKRQNHMRAAQSIWARKTEMSRWF